jgi:hypothetical protein
MMMSSMSRLSAQDVEDLKRRQQDRDYSIEPRRGPKRATGSALTTAEVERLQRVLLNWIRSS